MNRYSYAWTIAALVIGILLGARIAARAQMLPVDESAAKSGGNAPEIHGGWYGWIGNHKVGGWYDPQMDAAFLRRHHIRWYWLSHQWVLPFLVADMADVRETMIDVSRRARIWVELYWWGDHSTWEGFVGMDYPGLYDALQASGAPAGGDDIRGKDWFAIAEDPAVMASVKKSIKWQLDEMVRRVGPDTIYGVILSEEEPDHGIHVTVGQAGAPRYDQNREATRRLLARVHNELYAYVKSLYPQLKVSPGFYPAWVEPGLVQADAVVMDNYPPPHFEEQRFQQWQAAYGDLAEQYVLLWGYGNLDHRLETERLHKIVSLYVEHGTRNIGFFRPELSLRDPIFRLFDSRGVGAHAAYDLEEHRRSVAALADETRRGSADLTSIAASFPEPNVSEATSREALCSLADQIYAYRAKLLEKAYEKALQTRQWVELGQLITLASVEGWLPAQFTTPPLPDAKQIGQWEILSKEFGTLRAFYDAVLPPEAELQRTAEAMAAALPAAPAALGAVARALRAGDYPAAFRDAAAARTLLAQQKAEKSWEVLLEFGNPYPYVLNCEVTLTADYGGGQTREIYRGMPFVSSPGPVESHTFYLPHRPSALTLATGSWSGSLQVRSLRVFNSRGTLTPQTVSHDHVSSSEEFLKDPAAGLTLTPWASTAVVTLRY